MPAFFMLSKIEADCNNWFVQLTLSKSSGMLQ